MVSLVRKQWTQLRALSAEFLPVLAAAVLIFLVLAVLGPFTYGYAGAVWSL